GHLRPRRRHRGGGAERADGKAGQPRAGPAHARRAQGHPPHRAHRHLRHRRAQRRRGARGEPLRGAHASHRRRRPRRLRRLRRAPARLLPILVLVAGLPALPGCGGGSLSSLVVSLNHADSTAAVKAGDTPSFTLSIVNSGPQAASGVSARVELPDGVTYLATENIDIDPYGVLRTQPQDPGVRSNNPAWGVWTLNAPVSLADGTVRRPHVDITFTVNVQSRAGTFKLVPHVFSDSTDGEVVGKGANLTVGPSGHLTVTIAAVPNRVKREDDVTYLLTVNN